jgi:Zn-dependent metalloprotease
MKNAGGFARLSLGLDLAAPIERQELILYAPIDGETRLAYKFELHAAAFDHRLVVVDAVSGDILESINQVCTAATVGSGMDLGGQTRSVNLWTEGSRHYMVDASKPMFDAIRSIPPSPGTTFGGIIILDAKGVDPNVNPGAYAPEVISSASTTSGLLAAGISASFNLSIVHDYFLERHQRNSIDAQGGTIIGVVNVPILSVTSWRTA